MKTWKIDCYVSKTLAGLEVYEIGHSYPVRSGRVMLLYRAKDHSQAMATYYEYFDYLGERRDEEEAALKHQEILNWL